MFPRFRLTAAFRSSLFQGLLDGERVRFFSLLTSPWLSHFKHTWVRRMLEANLEGVAVYVGVRV